MSVRVRSRSGFTLVELMIAIVIIGVMAAAVAPSLSEVLADTREAAAAQDIVQLSRRARALALGSGIAHLLRFQQASSNGLGTIELFSGMNGKCMQTAWPLALQAPSTGPGARLGALDVLDMAFYNPTTTGVPPSASDTTRQVIVLSAQVGAAATAVAVTCLCYQPNGDVYMETNTDPVVIVLARQTSFIRFIVSRSINGSPRGNNREVMFPVGGSARLR